MIIFKGIKIIDKIPHIMFESSGNIVEVPIDIVTADRIAGYLNKINNSKLKHNG